MKSFFKVIVTLVLAALLVGALYWNKLKQRLPVDQSGWSTYSGEAYRLDEDGHALTGWYREGDMLYYLDPARGGARSHGLTMIDGKCYYFSDTGAKLTGWQTDRGRNYYFNDEGTAVSGWQVINGKTYYFGADYAALEGHEAVDGTYYFFDNDGAVLTGWQETPDGIYYLNEDGSAWVGWMEDFNDYRYFDETGLMATGWLDIDDSSFYMDEDGRLITGWIELEERLAEDEIERLQKKADSEGKKLVIEPRKILYYFREDGIMATGWTKIRQDDYYFQPDGQKLSNGRILSAGQAARGRVQTIDQGVCYFSSNGKLIPILNKWNSYKSFYNPNLYDKAYGVLKMTQDCADALSDLMNAARNAVKAPSVRSAYMDEKTSNQLYAYEMKKADGAEDEVLKRVSPPAYDEHRLGTTVDILPSAYSVYDADKLSQDATMQWLMENSWKYGFILRYPKGFEAMTGVPFRPWQYRYVGVDVATEIHNSKTCLEGYIDELTALDTKPDELLKRCGGKNTVSK